MTSHDKPLADLLQELPSERQSEVQKFVKLLSLTKRKVNSRQPTVLTSTKPPRIVKAKNVAPRTASEREQLDHLERELTHLLRAVKNCCHAKRVGKDRPQFPKGREPITYMPRIITLSFDLFYAENTPQEEKDSDGQ